MLTPRHRPKSRKFHYEPRFHDPSEEERKQRRVRFESKTRRGKQPAFIAVAVALLLVLYVYTQL
jgi:hypothetical protein